MDEYETCDTCGKSLSIELGEDFFVETDRSSFVFCEDCWKRYEEEKTNNTYLQKNTRQVPDIKKG